MEIWVKIRNTIASWKYRWFLKPILFRFDPEDVHDLFIKVGKLLGATSATRWITKFYFYYENKALEQEILGLRFKNPIGLAAGFDKNAELTKIIPSVGFGFTEVGSVTGRPCLGNSKPRLWRLPKSRSLIVYYGLKNDGAEEIAKRLKNPREETSGSSRTHLGNLRNFPIGVSIAKTNDDKTTTTEAGIADYLFAYKTFVEAGVGDYYTINISCPNTFGGEPFIEKEKLDKLLSALYQLYRPKPIFIKLPPDLRPEQLNDIIELAKKYNISGFICSNLTKDRNNDFIKNKIIEKDLPTNVGGLSGKIVGDLATAQIKYLYQQTGGEFVIIGCGGIFSAQDAYDKIKAGASLLQMITGMIFEGPQVISEINQGLVKLLKEDGYRNISEAIGKGVEK